MFVVNKKDVKLVEETTTLFCEASEVGLPPGEWPDIIVLLDEEQRGLLFGPTYVIDPNGGREYHSHSGPLIKLHVLND
jgi:hypothetical protein